MEKRILLASPHMSDENYELEYIKEAFDTNWIAPVGPNINAFEKEIAERVGVKYTAAVASGTSAIHLALKASNVKEGDIIFCQSLTFSASANPIIYEKAVPVFIDSNYETWNMCPKALEQAFIKYPEVKAVIVVHLYGLPADLDKILELCKKYNVVLIEDAAESLGTTYKGRETGSFGDYGVYSFNGNKIITTSGGGMFVSNNKKDVEKIKFWASQSKDEAIHYQHSELGYNYQMSNISAGIGRGQLKVLDKRIAKKKYIYDYYKKNLSHLEGVSFMPSSRLADPNCWLSVMITKGSIKVLDIINTLDEHNIDSRRVWKPMHLQPFYEKYDYVGTDVSYNLFKKGVCLPSDTKMTDKDLDRVIKAIQDLWDVK